MDNMEKGNEVVKINIGELLYQIVTKRYVLIAIVAFCVLVMFSYTKLTYVARYKSCAKIYIMDTESADINSSEITVSTYLAHDYLELIVDRSVLNEVIDELNLNMSYSSLKNCINVNAPDQTRIIEVYVTTTDPQKSMRIAQKICEVAQKKINTIIELNRINIASPAFLPKSPIASNMPTNLIYGFAGGVLLAIAYIFIVYSMNDRINNGDDIETYLGIPLLGSIPYHSSKGKKYGYGYGYGYGAKKGKSDSEVKKNG